MFMVFWFFPVPLCLFAFMQRFRAALKEVGDRDVEGAVLTLDLDEQEEGREYLTTGQHARHKVGSRWLEGMRVVLRKRFAWPAEKNRLTVNTSVFLMRKVYRLAIPGKIELRTAWNFFLFQELQLEQLLYKKEFLL